MTYKNLCATFLLTTTTFFLGLPAQGQDYSVLPNTPVHIRNAVESADRKPEDVARDAGRMPAEVLTLADLNEGDSIIELSAYGQYYSDILAAAIGPQGHLYMYDLDTWAEFGAGESGSAFAAIHDNTSHELAAFDETVFPEGADAAYNILSYHDLPAYGSETAGTNTRLFNALKPGGKYLIIDHLAEDGSGWRDADTIHRIDKSVIIEEVLAAGFELLIDSSLLAHPEDPRTAGVYELRGATDRAVLLFQKPW